MNLKSCQKLSFIIPLILVVVSITRVAYAQTSDVDSEPLAPAIEQIEAAGEYSFIAQVEQTLIPRPIPINVGKTEQRIDSQMSGRVVLPDFAQIDLQFEASGELPPITIEQDGPDVYVIKDGERTQIENPLAVSPTTDFLGYIEAAHNVRSVDNPDQPQLTVYRFDIDGEAYSEYMLKQIRGQLPAEQKGAHIDLPESIQKMSGSGELWVDQAGYPQRQILDIFIPEANEQFDSQSQITVDYRFETELTGVAFPTAEEVANVNPTAVIDHRAGEAVAPVGVTNTEILSNLTLTILALLLFCFALLLIVAVFYATPNRWVRLAVPVGMALLMFTTPILQPLAYLNGAAQHAAAELPSLAEALGLHVAESAEPEEDVAAAQAEAPEAPPLITSSQTQAVANNPITCGTGNTTTDTDQDGTSDFVENCLGTDPFNFDSDFDGITDTLEINGFVFTDTQNITHTIYSNPLEQDSNNDGFGDILEYPLPIGFASSHDPDGDNVPNLWDEDNDGDGVNDKDDIDPFSKSAYRPDFAIRTGLNGSSFTGTQYIEFQVQPQDQSRFQLLTTELDWPFDDQGSLQARNTARQDELTFAPMLKIEANTIPTEFRSQYGVTVVRQGGRDVIYVDLAPVSEGGRIKAFYGKVAYNQFQLNDINWSKVEMVWTAFMKHSPVNQSDNSRVSIVPVAEFTEPSFRFAGLEVTKSGSSKYAVIGTPNAQTDHRNLINLVAGLEGSFLSSSSADFDTIINRLNSPTTAITDTWGVPASEIAVGLPFAQPLHADMAFIRPFDTNSTISAFLANNSYSTADYASLIMAVESQSGTDGLDGDVVISGNTFTFNLAQIPVYTSRTVNLSHYEHNGTGWTDANDLTAINSLIANYTGDPAAAVTALRLSYPQISEADLAVMMLTFYMIWLNGQTSTVSADGINLIGETENAQALYTRIGLSTIRDPLVYLVEAYRLGDPSGSVVFSDPATFAQFSNSSLGGNYYTVSTLSLFSFRFVLRTPALISLVRGNYTNWGYSSVQMIADGYAKLTRSILGYQPTKTINAVKFLPNGNRIQVASVVNSGKPKTGIFGIKLVKTSARIVKFAKVIAKLTRVVAVVGAATTIALAWITFSQFSSPYGYERTYAAVYAGVETVVALVYLIAGFSGIGTFFLIGFIIIDLIGWIVTSQNGEPIESIVATSIARTILDVDPYTRVDEVDYRGMSTRVDGDGYIVAGRKVTLQDRFYGSISGYLNDFGSNGQNPYLNDSDIYSTLDARAAANITVNAGHDATNRADRCTISGSYKICRNNLWADFTFANAGRDQQVELFYRITANTRYAQRSLGGLVNTTRTDVMNLPDELEDEDQWTWLPIKIDVLPNTLSGLLTWSELTNHDFDGDDIPNSAENAIPNVSNDIDGDTLLNNIDWDRDGDGLGDGFETSSQNSLGTDPNRLDADSDGLNDGVEYQIGTNINQADSDSDGLNDGAEIYRWTGSQWTGGGWFITINGQRYWVFSNPQISDQDRDGIPDGSERANGTSPHAFNDAPEIQLDAGPLLSSPNGSNGVYVKAGQTVTGSLRIFNTGSSAISQRLSYCVPSALSAVELTVTGDVTPATQINSNCYEWDFSSSNLGLFQTFNVAVTAQATGSTLTDTISASLPYAVNGAPQPISVTIPFIQDNTAPTVQLTDPITSSILTSQFYVMGGYAQDTASWLDRVEVSVPGTTTNAQLTDSQWSYTWQLPADGVVTVSATAYDALGNASAPSSVQVTVDTQAPTLSINLAQRATVSAGQAYSTTLPLNGTVTDNFAGVERIQLRNNDGPWRTIWNDSNKPLSTSWNGVWSLPTVDSAQGEHLLSLRAYDGFGNVSTLTRTVFIDVLPPTNGLTNQAFIQETPKHVPGGQPVNLAGVASDAGNNPLPADPETLSGTLNSISDATVWLGLDNLADNDGGATVTWIGDMNGDRLGDLAVGLPGANGGSGKVIVVNGRPGGWPSPNIGELELLRTNSPSYSGGSNDRLGTVVQPAGDVNSDGLDDLLIGDPDSNRVMLVLGSANSFAFEQSFDAQANNQIEITAQGSGESLSSLRATAVAGVGDVTNDGADDMLITVSTTTGSRIYLLPGDIPLFGDQRLDSLSAAYLDTSSANVSVAGVGDVDSDFISDFAIAIDGTVYLFAGGGGWTQGGLSPLSTSAAIATYTSSDSLPTIVAAGDINGDSIDDFAFTNGATPTVVFGNASGSFTTQTLSGFPSPLTGFLAAVGDVNKNGRGDLLVGNSSGDAYLISGSNLTAAVATFSGVTAAASTPFVAAADLAGDGSSDLALVPSGANATTLGFNGFADPITQPPFISQSALPQVSLAAAGDQSETPAGEQPLFIDAAQVAGDVTVGPVGATYTSIQAAIDSGATRVLVQPGVYAEAITLTTGVTLIGSGPDRTVLRLPGGSSASALVTASGISNAALQNMTLRGSGSQTGFAVSNGATGIRLERTVIQNMGTAVSVDGSTSTLALKNNSIIGNSNGFRASNSAGVDVRNTIFAFNSGTALQYDSGAVLKLHQYNLYYANGTDLTPNNPGGGELFSDPLFLDYANGDFRTQPFSPAIDAGTPNNPVPPGSGRAVDIGHLEQSGSSFFTDDGYCSTCLNDGLIWGVNAFNTVQAAVDAAQEDIANLQLETPIQFKVGVNDGVYTESVVISTSVSLLGQGPDRTTIVGSSGPAVTYQAAVNAGVTGFTLRGGGTNPLGVLLKGGSNTINIDYNYIISSTVGISVTERSSGYASFNTITGNTTGVEISRGTYWNTTNIVDGGGNVIGTTRALGDSCTSTIKCEERGFVWLDLSNSIVSGNNEGLAATGKAVLFSDSNLLFNTTDYSNVISGTNDIRGQNPLLAGPHGYLQEGSPALDKAPFVARTPAGGGLRADLGWHELLAAPISILMGQPDESLATNSIGVGSVQYAVVPITNTTLSFTATLPSTWSTATLSSPGQKLSYWQVNYTPPADGLYRLYSRATDSLGNRETDINTWYDGAFVVDSSPPVITLTQQTYTVNNWLLLEAQVLDYIGTSFDVDDVYFTLNGERIDGRWKVEQWRPDGSTPRTFSYLYQNNSGQNIINGTVQAFAIDGAGNIGSSSTQIVNIAGIGSGNQFFDTLPPRSITVTQPLPGAFVANSVTFRGIVADDGAAIVGGQALDSRTAGVDLSFDGGLTWAAARLIPITGTDPLLNLADWRWDYSWTVPAGLDATTIPVRVRATDYAGNFRSEIITVTLDTGPPRPFFPVFNIPEGRYIDNGGNQIQGPYTPPLDGSGWVTGTDFITNTDGTYRLVNTGLFSVNGIGSEGGSIKLIEGVRDEANNVFFDEFGPWWPGDAALGPDWAGLQALNRNGIMDISNSEWITATELLDNDQRPLRSQNLWVTWDHLFGYLAWQGASWGPDGELWAYYDLIPGGSTTAIEGGRQLPFAADFAVKAQDANTAFSYTYNTATGSWTSVQLTTPAVNPFQPGYGHNPNREETEMRIYFNGLNTGSGTSWNRMMAYAEYDSGEVWSAFPTANRLDGPFTYFFEWPKTGDPFYLLNLPTAAREPAVDMTFTSRPGVQDTVSTNDTITYVANITSLESEPITGVQLVLTGTVGLSYKTITGVTSFSCPAPTSCTLNLPTIPAGGSQAVKITARTAANLSGISQITTTPLLRAQLPVPLADLTRSHQVDITPPTVTITPNPGQVIGSGTQQVSGTADDGQGAGVSLVEVSTDGVNWQPATGTQSWTANIVAPAGSTSTLYARATDYHGQISPVSTQTLVLDSVAPLITVTVPTLVGGSSFTQINGEISDPAPAGAQVATVEAQLDRSTAPWENAAVYNRIDGTQVFIYAWALPAEDGITHTIRFRATDFGGNVTTTAFSNVTVDTVAPRITVTSNTAASPVSGPTLAGTLSEGDSIQSFSVSYYTLAGVRVVDQITPVNGSWSYSSGQPVGTYSMLLQVTDRAGNERRVGPLAVTISNAVPQTANLTGTLAFVGRGTAPNAQWVEPLTVTLHAAGIVTPTYSFNTTTDQSGQFTVSGMTPGTYAVGVKTPNSLRIVQQVTLTAGSNTASFGTLAGGDVNGDNEVTLLDFSILSASFNLSQGSPGYDARADLNGDGQVTALDFSILSSNFNTTGQSVGN
ncbi:MAG: dockerin type I domain-containing protein [Chloroflexota bacterium]